MLVIVSALMLASLVECQYEDIFVLSRREVRPWLDGGMGWRGPAAFYRPDLGQPQPQMLRASPQDQRLMGVLAPQQEPPIFLTSPHVIEIQRLDMPAPPGLTCLQACPTTRDYNPVCVLPRIGGAKRDFPNLSSVICEQRCNGMPIRNMSPGPCTDRRPPVSPIFPVD